MKLHNAPRSNAQAGFGSRGSTKRSPSRVVARRALPPVEDATKPSTSTDTPVESFHADGDASKCPVLSALRPLPPPPSLLQSIINTRLNGPTKELDNTFGGQSVAAGRFMSIVPAVMVGTVPALREILTNEPSGALTVGWPPATRALLGEQSVTCLSDVEKHKFLRKLMAPALGQEAVEGYLPEIHDIVKDTLEGWATQNAAKQEVLALPGLKNMTLRIICSVALDMTLSQEEQVQVSKDFNQWVSTLFTPLAIDRWPFPFHASMQARKRLVALIERRLDEVRTVLAGGAGALKAKSTLRLLLTAQDEQGVKLTQEQVVDNLLTLLFAGHDTTSSQLSRLLNDMALHPEVLARVREEQLQVMRVHGPSMTPAALRDMIYTQAVLSESMRTQPIIGGGVRTSKSDMGVQGNLVPKDNTVLLSYSYMMRKDPRWPEATMDPSDPLHPSRYNPDRFMTEEGSKQGAQVPFGMGSRACAGIALAQAEAKIFFATLARGYKFSADTNTEWELVPMVRPANQLPVVLERL